MLKSTKMRRNIKVLANLELAEALTDVKARRVAGSTLMGAWTSEVKLRKSSGNVHYHYLQKRIRQLLAE